MTLAAYVAEDGLVGHQWEEWTLVLWGFYFINYFRSEFDYFFPLTL